MVSSLTGNGEMGALLMAPIVAACVNDTARVDMEKVAWSDPAATTSPGGTTAAVSLELRPTDTPSPGAGPVSRIVPETLVPPVTDAGLS